MESVPLVLVATNPYTLTHRAGFGTRARLHTGELGVSTVQVRGASDVAAFVAAEATGQLACYQRFREPPLHSASGPERRRRHSAEAPVSVIRLNARKGAGPLHDDLRGARCKGIRGTGGKGSRGSCS